MDLVSSLSLGHPHPGGLYSCTAFVCDKEQLNRIFLRGASEVMFSLSLELDIPETLV